MNDTVENTAVRTTVFSGACQRMFDAPEDVAGDAPPRILFSSPPPHALIEDAQNEGCNI